MLVADLQGHTKQSSLAQGIYSRMCSKSEVPIAQSLENTFLQVLFYCFVIRSLLLVFRLFSKESLHIEKFYVQKYQMKENMTYNSYNRF